MKFPDQHATKAGGRIPRANVYQTSSTGFLTGLEVNSIVKCSVSSNNQHLGNPSEYSNTYA
jgi:hypothetical protein